MTNELTVSPDESGERMRTRQINDAPLIVATHGRKCGDPFQTPLVLYARNAFPDTVYLHIEIFVFNCL